MFHIGAIAYVVAVMHAGAHIPLPAFDPVAVLKAITAQRATHVTLVPTMIARVLDSMDAASADLPLRRIIYAPAHPRSAADARHSGAAGCRVRPILWADRNHHHHRPARRAARHLRRARRKAQSAGRPPMARWLSARRRAHAPRPVNLAKLRAQRQSDERLLAQP